MNIKGIVKSLTIQGAAVTTAGVAGVGGVIAIGTNAIGLDISPEEIDGVVAGVGIILTVIGRWKAKGPLKERT